MRELRNFLKKHNLTPKSYTFKNNVKIIDTSEGKFVLKKKTKNEDILNYLHNRGFTNFISSTVKDSEYNIYPYVDNYNIPREQTASDLINVIALLHNKTSFHKDIDIDFYKEIFEETSKKIDYLFNYYEDLNIIIDKEIYMRPSSYLLARNISKIYACLSFLREEIKEWYELVKDKTKVRLVTIHNRLSLEHFITNNDSYLINFDYAKIDLPIYDLIYFYQQHYLDLDFESLLNQYQSRVKLLDEEIKLLFIFISLPPKLELTGKVETDKCKQIRRLLDYIYKSEQLGKSIYKETKEKGVKNTLK